MKKYDNFSNALNNLKHIYDYEEPVGTVEITGMVGLFEICFEQAWKAIKEIMENSGYMDFKTGSPRQIIKAAYSAGLIDDEELWLSALVDRNNVAHSYNEAIAMSIINNSKQKYVKMFQDLKNEMDSNWL